MTRLMTLVSAALLVVVVAACEPYTVHGPGEYSGGTTASPRIITTYESLWIGQYEGSGEVRLLTTGDDFTDVTACLDLWVDDTYFHTDAYVRLLSSPLEFKEISDGTYSGGQPAGCAAGEGGVRFEAVNRISEITSKDSVFTLNWEDSFFGIRRAVVLLIERGAQDEFLTKIVVSRDDPLCAPGASCQWIKSARLTFNVTQVT